MGALFCFVFWHEKETHLTVWRLELKWLRTVAENTVRLEESQEVQWRIAAAAVKVCFLSFMVTRQIGEWFNKAGWKKNYGWTCVVFALLMKFYLGRSVEHTLKQQNRWPAISAAFTPFTFAAFACLCSIKWMLQICLIFTLV